MPLFSQDCICACTLAQTIFNLVKGGISEGQFRNKFLIQACSQVPHSEGSHRCVISCKWTLGKTPRNILAVCSRLVKAYSNMVTLSWFLSCVSPFFWAQLDSMQRFVLFVFEQRLGIVWPIPWVI